MFRLPHIPHGPAPPFSLTTLFIAAGRTVPQPGRGVRGPRGGEGRRAVPLGQEERRMGLDELARGRRGGGFALVGIEGHRPQARRRRDARLGKPAGMVHRRRSEEHTSELQSLMRSSYAVFCLTKTQKSTTLNRGEE